VFIIAIIERKNLLDESKKWFDLFRVLFELVSAFGGIGLSLGFPSVWTCSDERSRFCSLRKTFCLFF
jgi:Trk-type K+ transport system membrane component